ncbi:MAG: EVE domain-containing protein [Pirellulales bacterium]
MASARCWLVKSEPECFSIHNLAASPDQTTCWAGVRNYQARNFMRDGMKLGDRVLFYHSSTDPPAVAGTAVVAREAYPDNTAWNPRDDHYDPKASPANPIWQMVDIRLVEIFAEPVPIGVLRGVPALRKMELLRTGSRLSVQPVTPQEFEAVLQLARHKAGRSATSSQARQAKSPAPKSASRAVKRPAQPGQKKVTQKTAARRPRKSTTTRR